MVIDGPTVWGSAGWEVLFWDVSGEVGFCDEVCGYGGCEEEEEGDEQLVD